MTGTQQAILSLLARCRREVVPYPSIEVMARELGLDRSAVPPTVRRLEQLGALTLAPALGGSREGKTYARRLTLVWDDERIALGGAEQRRLWREA